MRDAFSTRRGLRRPSVRRPSLPPDLSNRMGASFRDHYLWALVILALVLNLALFGYLIFEFNRNPPVLPPLLPLHFDPSGEPDRIEQGNAIFSLAQIGLVVIVGNLALGGLLYRRERLASYLLAGVSIVVQLLLWYAAIQIIRIATL